MEKKDVYLSLRITSEIHRKLRFVAANEDVSVNEIINLLLLEGLAAHHISVPSDLLSPVTPQ